MMRKARVVVALLMASAVTAAACTDKNLTVGSGPEVGGDAGAGDAGAVDIVDLATNQVHPVKLALAGDYVYWRGDNLAAQAVFAVRKTGGQPRMVFAGPNDGNFGLSSRSLAVDAANLYDYDDQGGITAFPAAGGSTRTVVGAVNRILVNSAPGALAVANGRVYWLEVGTSGSPPTPTNVLARSVGVEGGSPRTEESFPLVPDSQGAALLTDFAVGSDAVYAMPLANPEILSLSVSTTAAPAWRIPFDGSPASQLELPLPNAFAADDQSLYLAVDGSLKVYPKTGSGDPPYVSPPPSVIPMPDGAAIAVDATYLYVAQQSPTNHIAKVAKTGGPMTTITDHAGNPLSIAVDDQYVYWAAADDGAIRRAPK